MTPPPRIIGVSDVSLGYGSPQIGAFMNSIADHFSTDAMILEPDEHSKKPVHRVGTHCSVKRIPLPTSPFSTTGRRLYILNAARELDRQKPDLLVLFCSFTVPVLLRMKHRPKFTLYNAIESIAAYGESDIEIHRIVSDQIDLLVFPEENRAVHDIPRAGLREIPLAITYNAVNERTLREPTPASKRNGRFLYSGTLSRENTLAGYFLEDELQQLPIDLFGNVSGPDAEDLSHRLSASEKALTYQGYIPAESLAVLREKYAFSLTLWAPINENQLYAAPNKFFEAIAAGVPPITTPHPQCKMLIERYDCGLVAPDWSIEGLSSTLESARRIYGTPRYAELVANCARAVREELNWEAQFAKVQRLLPTAL
ncbi:hypothetical protein MK489_24765 [Myxococcota bacterium]|nr:hypothetical protein [Myxococcota bacterium]